MIYGKTLGVRAFELSRKIRALLQRTFSWNDADLEDVQQAAIEKLLVYGQTDCEAIMNVDGFVWEATRRTALDLARARDARLECRWCRAADDVADPSPSTDEMLKWYRRAQLVVQAARRLPKPLRKVLWLCKREQLSYRETAQRLKVSEAEVKNRLAQAVYRLKQSLETRQ